MPMNIMAATDFSPMAEYGVERAASLAQMRRCPLRLLHVHNAFGLEQLRALRPLVSAMDEAESAAERRLRLLARDLMNRYQLPEVDVAVVSGRASTGIASRARETGAGLIALGAHGSGILQDLALGGTAIKVLRNAPCPVLVVRKDWRLPYETIMVASDFSPGSCRAFEASISLFPEVAHVVVNAYSVAMEGRLRMAGAGQEDIDRCRRQAQEVARQRMDGFVRESGFAGRVRTHLRHGYASSVLVEECRRLAASLLVVGRHGASELDEKLLGSVTLNLLHHAPSDVLLVP